MAKLDPSSTLKRLRNRYRLVVMNDDTYEEVVTFRLTRTSVYISLSMIFVLLVGLTVALLVLTPLRYYIPGYGTRQSQVQLQMLKMRTDSLEQSIQYKDRYLDNIRKILNGENPVIKDTAVFKVPEHEVSKD
ncbi:MAG: hypothetical protein JWN76_2929 [Chitinophagaceae bacterium]|nr:hypothetical protein [Chitinophagaceae bacterium]